MSPKDIVHIFCAKIRPVLEYACPVWHGGLTDELTQLLEHVQERALRIAYPGVEYLAAMTMAGIPPLYLRRELQCKSFFQRIQDPEDKLHRILPTERSNLKNTRNGTKYPLPDAKTERYKNSFLPYALFNLQ